MTILVTGGAGFIGANFVLDWLAQSDVPVINLDKLIYAGNLENLNSLKDDDRHIFVHGDVGDSALVGRLLAEHQPRAILKFAAESHVERSIHGPEDFIETNIVGTFRLLEAVRAYWKNLTSDARQAFRFLHVSTDEVYGSRAKDEPAFSESHQYEPDFPVDCDKYTDEEGALLVDKVLRYETLESDLKSIMEPLDVPFVGLRSRSKSGFRGEDITLESVSDVDKKVIYGFFSNSLKLSSYSFSRGQQSQSS